MSDILMQGWELTPPPQSVLHTRHDWVMRVSPELSTEDEANPGDFGVPDVRMSSVGVYVSALYVFCRICDAPAARPKARP